MFITGPDVVKTVTGEEVVLEELGGASAPRGEVGRSASHGAAGRGPALEDARYLLSFLPQSNTQPTTVRSTPADPVEEQRGRRPSWTG